MNFTASHKFRNLSLPASWAAALSIWALFYFRFPLTINEGIYLTVAQALSRGARLYTDIWDHKPPLIFVLYRAALYLNPNVDQACHVLVYLCHFVNGLLLIRLYKKLFGSDSPWFVLLAYLALIASPHLQAWTAQADLLLLTPLLGSVVLAMENGLVAALLSGALWSISFFVKPTAILFIPLPLKYCRKYGYWAVGANLVAACVAFPFILDHRQSDLSGAIWGANAAYSMAGWRDFSSGQAWFEFTQWSIGAVLTFWSSLFSGILVARKFSILGIWILLGLLSCLISGNFYNYYFLVLIPPFALSLAWFLSEWSSGLRWRRWYLIGLALVPAFGFLVAVGIEPEKALLSGEYSISRMAEGRDIGREIAAIKKPGDELFVWAFQMQTYAYSGIGPSMGPKFVPSHLNASDLSGIRASISDPFRIPKFIVLEDNSLLSSIIDPVITVSLKKYALIEKNGNLCLYLLTSHN